MLKDAKRTFGAVPNLFGAFAESPATLKAYTELGSMLETSSAFTPTALQIVLLATSFENDCAYCMAAHTAIAGLRRVPQGVIESLRDGTVISDPKLEALRRFAVIVVRRRGWVEEQDVQAFLDAGYTRRHLLEVILGVAFKTLSNFTNHIASTPLDAHFERFAWSKTREAVAAR